MADTPTTRYGARLQSLGSNVNTWGETKLNEVFQLLDRGSKGYQALTITGDATITWANYVATNDGQVATLKLSGSPSGSFTLTLPSKEWEFDVINASGQTGTLKCAGGTGVSIPAGRTVRLYCDGTDIYTKVANYQPSPVTLTNTGDLPTYGQVQTLIANAAVPAASGAVKVTVNDTGANYLSSKINVTASGASVVTTVTNPGANEVLNIALTVTPATIFSLTDGGTKTSSFAASTNSRYRVDASGGSAYTATGPAAPSAGDVLIFDKVGASAVTFNLNGLKHLGLTANPILITPGTYTFVYTGATLGWVSNASAFAPARRSWLDAPLAFNNYGQWS